MRTFRKAVIGAITGLSLTSAVHGQNWENTIIMPTTKNLIENLEATEDTILYTTIGEMNKKYGNPEISQEWKKSRNKCYGRFSNKNNMIYINPECKENKMLEIRIRLSELSHSKQLKEGKLTNKRIIHDQIIWILNGFDQIKMYEIEGTIEYEAHQIIEPEIIHEFIKTYVSKIDTNNIGEVEKAEQMMSYYYDYTRKQADTLEKNLQFIINKKKQKELAEEKEIEELNKKIKETHILSEKLLKEMNQQIKKQEEEGEKMAKELDKMLGEDQENH